MDAPNLTPPAGNPRFALFDSLRAIAALSVLFDHTVTQTYPITGHPRLFRLAAEVGDQGVAIFFLISGFLLYRPFLTARRDGRSVSLRVYLRRRALRIVPCYWAALTIFIAAGFVSGVTGSNFWIFYGFGQVYSLATTGHGIGVAWTLCIEVTFYAALPLFALLAAKLARGTASLRGDALLLFVLAAASLAYRDHFSGFLDLTRLSTLPGFFFWFALGMGAAIASVSGSGGAIAGLSARPRHWPELSWALAALLFVLLYESPSATARLGIGLTSVTTHVLYGLAAFFLLLPAIFGEATGGPVRALLRCPTLAWIGLVSYAVYLYHSIVIAQLSRLLTDHGVSPRYPIVAVGSLAVTLVCAAISFYVLERPLMRLPGGGAKWPRRSSRRRPV